MTRAAVDHDASRRVMCRVMVERGMTAALIAERAEPDLATSTQHVAVGSCTCLQQLAGSQD